MKEIMFRLIWDMSPVIALNLYLRELFLHSLEPKLMGHIEMPFDNPILIILLSIAFTAVLLFVFNELFDDWLAPMMVKNEK